jgi:hypothetical protein
MRDKPTDPAMPQMLTYAAPRREGEELPGRQRRFTLTLLDALVLALLILIIVLTLLPVLSRARA